MIHRLHNTLHSSYKIKSTPSDSLRYRFFLFFILISENTAEYGDLHLRKIGWALYLAIFPIFYPPKNIGLNMGIRCK